MDKSERLPAATAFTFRIMVGIGVFVCAVNNGLLLLQESKRLVRAPSVVESVYVSNSIGLCSDYLWLVYQ